MARTRVQLIDAGMEQLLTSDGVRDLLTDRGERGLAHAKANAPVATGEYRDDLHLEQDTTDRAVVRIVSSVSHGLVVEAKTGNLARALDAAGGS